MKKFHLHPVSRMSSAVLLTVGWLGLLAGCTTWALKPSAPDPKNRRASTQEVRDPFAAPTSSRMKLVSFEASGGVIRIRQSLPPEVAIGDEFVIDVLVSAKEVISNVKLSAQLFSRGTVMRSEPEATLADGKLYWSLGKMEANESRSFKLYVKAEEAGDIVCRAAVGESPQIYARTTVGKPELALEQTGPGHSLIGGEVTFKLLVKNVGKAAATKVIVKNPVPAGCNHESGKPELTYEVGELSPGQSKTLSVAFKALQRGKICNVATASSSNAPKVSAEACTQVQVPGLKIETSGAKEQILGRNADYEIVVENTGDTVFRSVTVNELAPAETAIVAAPGAKIQENTATWVVADLAPKSRSTNSFKLTSKVAGTHCGTATVTAGALTESTKSCTLWKGIAAIGMEVSDDPDPIQIGETTTYTIKVTNQGFADLHNIKVEGRFGEKVAAVSSLQGTLNDNVVNFPVVAALGPKQSFTYKVTVKGAAVGDSRNRVILQADELKSPLEEAESTTIY